jgi:glycosyltransferase involved in cell wall biosynthesis
VVLAALIERISVHFADRVIVTHDRARELTEVRGTPPRKITVVLNCPDEARFPLRPPEVVHAGETSFDIVTHGLILERFGIQVLIDALPRLADEIPGVRLRIIGKGEYQPELERLARANGVADRVAFHDWVPVEELPGQLSGASIGYVGMLCDLMLSNKLMEYVALGIPVVAARWPTYERYFPDAAVEYFSPGKVDELVAAVLRLYRDPKRCRAQALHATALYARYRWSVQLEAYLAVYRDLLTPDVGATGLPSPSSSRRSLKYLATARR